MKDIKDIKTLVIHPFDPTTQDFVLAYKDLGFDVITTNVSKKVLKDSIKSHDHIIFLGHGTSDGLIGFGRFVIDSKLVYLLRDGSKQFSFIWCNSDQFVDKYGLKGFSTGMIISDTNEAYDIGVIHNSLQILDSNILFSKCLNASFKSGLDSDGIHSIMVDTYKGDSGIINFNKDNLHKF